LFNLFITPPVSPVAIHIKAFGLSERFSSIYNKALKSATQGTMP